MNGISALNQWAETWAALAWNGLIETTILLGVIALIWLALRQRISSHAAYWLFLLVVIKAMLPLEIRAPQWLAQWTPQQAVITTVERTAPPIAFVAPPVTFSPARPAVETRAPMETFAPAAVERSQPPLTTQSWLMLAWVIAAGGLLARFAYNHLRARRYLRSLRPLAPEEMRVDYARLLALSGLRGAIPVYASPHIGSPAAFGLLRPCVIVPEDFFDSLKPEQASWALLHELAHIRRRDLWATAFQRVAQIVHFYNPAVWIANWAVDRFREYACDDEALALSGVNRKTCGAGLLSVAERAILTPRPVAETLGLLQSSSMIRRRIERILDARRVLQPRLSRPALLALILLGVVLLPYVRGTDSLDATDSQTRTEMATFTMVDAEPRAVDTGSYSLTGALVDQDSGAVLQGVVHNRQGQPISGAKLHLKSQATIPSEGIIGFYHPTQLVVAAESDANGAYRLPSIQPDADVLIVTAPGYGAKRLRLTPEAIAVGRLDLTLGEGGTIRGRVVGPNDEPQAEVRINVFNFPENLFTYEAVTDANGEYEMTGLPETTYYVRKWVQPYGEDEIRIVTVQEGETVAAGFGTGQRVAIEGTIFDENGSPIPNATVVLDVELFRSPLKLLAYADDEGRYQFFHEILPGEYLLTFHRPLDPNEQYPPGMLGFGMIGGDRGGFGFDSFGTKKEGDYVVRIEEGAGPVHADLQAGERQVSIRVIDSESGEPLEGARVGARMPLDRGSYRGVTDAQGEIQFNVWAIGVYSIGASKSGYVSAHANAKSAPKPQGVSNDDPVEIELQPASAWLKAHLHFEGRIPAKKEAGFKWLNTPHAPDLAYSLISEPVEGETGTMLVSGFPPGSYELAAFLAGGEEGSVTHGWVSAPQSIMVNKGQTLTRNFTLYEARRFQLIFRAPDFDAIPQQVEIEIEEVPGDFGRLVDFHTQRDIGAMLPINRGPARIKFPGYQPVEFTPEDVPTEPYSPITLRFDLKYE